MKRPPRVSRLCHCLSHIRRDARFVLLGTGMSCVVAMLLSQSPHESVWCCFLCLYHYTGLGSTNGYTWAMEATSCTVNVLMSYCYQRRCRLKSHCGLTNKA
ncbi:hypothetical protein BJ912DRAFT_983775 [Pholiota molesta]|nr:hypothetical protein BJ912DRAFT_983775 [Pholiota molesta]